MAEPVSFNCLYPPTSNHIFYGRRFKTKAYERWRRDAGWFIKAQFPRFEHSGDVEVKIELPYAMRAGDIDNRIKAILDVLVDVNLLSDDCFVCKLEILYVQLDCPFDVRITLIPTRGRQVA